MDKVFKTAHIRNAFLPLFMLYNRVASTTKSTSYRSWISSSALSFLPIAVFLVEIINFSASFDRFTFYYFVFFLFINVTDATADAVVIVINYLLLFIQNFHQDYFSFAMLRHGILWLHFNYEHLCIIMYMFYVIFTTIYNVDSTFSEKKNIREHWNPSMCQMTKFNKIFFIE